MRLAAESDAITCSDAVLVTGGAGFIGSNFVLDWLAAGHGPIVNLDKLTYAGNPENLASVEHKNAADFLNGLRILVCGVSGGHD